ncbi:MAG: response regulator [Lachnospiraceae bacterium]
MKLLLAEDDKDMAHAVETLLTRNHYVVDVVENGTDALEYLLNGDYDTAVLDIMMPGLDGITVLKEVRKQGIKLPVLLLTAMGETEDKIRGLDAGADDYLPKPFDAGEFLARVRALLRRVERFNPDVMEYGDICLDRNSYCLSCKDKRVRRKFILSTMLGMLVCTGLMIAFVNLANKWHVDKETTTILKELAAKDKMREFARKGMEHEEEKSEHEKHGDGKPEYKKDGPDHEDHKKDGPDHGGKIPRKSMEQYEKHFFVVTCDEDGIWEVDLEESDCIDENHAIELAKQVVDTKAESGYLRPYKYLIQKTGGETSIYFLDCSTELMTARMLLFLSIIVGCVGLGVVFLFSFFISKKAVEPLKKSMEEQKRFITDAGHELKTPVAVISTNMELLKMDLKEENEWVESTRRQVTKLRNLIADLISLSKLEENQKELNLVPLSFSQVISDNVEVYEMMAEAEGKELTASVEPQVWVNADETTFRQIFTILFENAVKYSNDYSKIEAVLEKKGKKAVFLIRNDWKHNIKTEELEKVFDRFYRGDQSRNRAGRKTGYGLGLSIAQTAVQKNRGKLTVYEDREQKLVFRAEFSSINKK